MAEGEVVARGFLDIPGGRVEYVDIEARRDDAPALVFLHEGLGCVGLWKDFPATVAASTGCRVLAYSRLGYGGSDPVALPRPLTYMHHEGLELLPAVLDAARIGRYIAVGHSDGASIAIIHAGGVRDARRDGLVLMAPHVFNELLSVSSIEKARDVYGHGLRDRLARYHGDNVDCAFRGWNDAWLDPGFLDWNIEEYLSGIDVPVLLVQGRDDEYGTLAQVEAIERQCGSTVQTMLLDDCGHSPHRDREASTREAITAFVSSIDQRREAAPIAGSRAG